MPFRSGIKFTPTALEFTIIFFLEKDKMVDYESKSLISLTLDLAYIHTYTSYILR